MEEEDNIFLKAAFSGQIQLPENAPSCKSGIGTSSSNSSSKKRKQKEQTRENKKKIPNHTYSSLEDMMIAQAIEQRGRDWRGVLQFMKNHADILGDRGDFYNAIDVNDRKMQDRIRKRAAVALREKR